MSRRRSLHDFVGSLNRRRLPPKDPLLQIYPSLDVLIQSQHDTELTHIGAEAMTVPDGNADAHAELRQTLEQLASGSLHDESDRHVECLLLSPQIDKSSGSTAPSLAGNHISNQLDLDCGLQGHHSHTTRSIVEMSDFRREPVGQSLETDQERTPDSCLRSLIESCIESNKDEETQATTRGNPLPPIGQDNSDESSSGPSGLKDVDEYSDVEVPIW